MPASALAANRDVSRRLKGRVATSRSDVAAALDRIGKAWEIEARQAAQPGLRDHITWVRTGTNAGALRLSAVAHFQNVGTKPHPIDARRSPNLVFYWEKKGRTFVGPHVNHPGFPARDFVESGWNSPSVRAALGTVPAGVTITRAGHHRA